MGDDCLLLPHRVEFAQHPGEVDRFFIDGPMERAILRYVIPDPGPSFAALTLDVLFILNHPKIHIPGVFVLSSSQLQAWKDSGP